MYSEHRMIRRSLPNKGEHNSCSCQAPAHYQRVGILKNPMPRESSNSRGLFLPGCEEIKKSPRPESRAFEKDVSLELVRLDFLEGDHQEDQTGDCCTAEAESPEEVAVDEAADAEERSVDHGAADKYAK